MGEFIDAVRECFREGGVAEVKDGVEQAGTFMLGVQGRLFTIQDDYQVAESAYDFHAIGSAEMVALGVMFATDGTRKGPSARITLALQAAAEFHMSVRAPWYILIGGRADG